MNNNFLGVIVRIEVETKGVTEAPAEIFTATVVAATTVETNLEGMKPKNTETKQNQNAKTPRTRKTSGQSMAIRKKQTRKRTTRSTEKITTDEKETARKIRSLRVRARATSRRGKRIAIGIKTRRRKGRKRGIETRIRIKKGRRSRIKIENERKTKKKTETKIGRLIKRRTEKKCI